ncbi:hypothetical protein [Sporomusa acidovorans]|uniref:Uncharacterized protein n=1 Tax=Sporomusa acidovorans (strain ATCC 49682 / DSM 3132 / Mol) TaxID=1123286 RepID=A0ABZ3IYZ1_SPOA4|nr:hypothetical protein [Sporomusa acidovorans]OZC14130.1 hypothetical protein SPACI_53050 [Sporomusa acidovorans DSM 3132]SDE69147.1 hypothetical protein SAMN04488499_101922 [Sporomusa acidovorans]
MLVKCFSCGIADRLADGKLWCLKYQFELSNAIAEEKSNCYYFAEPQYEDGEPLTAEQNLMIKECELASRRMRGPV